MGPAEHQSISLLHNHPLQLWEGWVRTQRGPPHAPNMKEEEVIREEESDDRGVMDTAAAHKVSLLLPFLSDNTRLFCSLDVFLEQKKENKEPK